MSSQSKTVKVVVGILVAVVVLGFLGRSALLEYSLGREEEAIKRILSKDPEKYKSVKVYRGASNYNLVEGEVATQKDIESLQAHLRASGIYRYTFAVRSKEMNE